MWQGHNASCIWFLLFQIIWWIVLAINFDTLNFNWCYYGVNVSETSLISSYLFLEHYISYLYFLKNMKLTLTELIKLKLGELFKQKTQTFKQSAPVMYLHISDWVPSVSAQDGKVFLQ